MSGRKVGGNLGGERKGGKERSNSKRFYPKSSIFTFFPKLIP